MRAAMRGPGWARRPRATRARGPSNGGPASSSRRLRPVEKRDGDDEEGDYSLEVALGRVPRRAADAQGQPRDRCPRSLALEAVAASLALGLGGSKNGSEGAEDEAEDEQSPTKPQRLAALRRAWLCAVANRLDANLVVDYAWPRFLERAGEFVEALGDDAALADLLCALRPESTLKAKDDCGGRWVEAALLLLLLPGARAAAALTPGSLWLCRAPMEAQREPSLIMTMTANKSDDEEEEAATKVAKQDKVRARRRRSPRRPEKRDGTNSTSTARSEASFLKPILTSYAVLGDLLSALAAVRRARERELAQEKERRRTRTTTAAPPKNPPPSPALRPLGLARRAAPARFRDDRRRRDQAPAADSALRGALPGRAAAPRRPARAPGGALGREGPGGAPAAAPALASAGKAGLADERLRGREAPWAGPERR